MVECTFLMHVSDVIVQNFGTKFLLRRGDCKTQEKSNFLKKGKIVISVKNTKFILYISDDETYFTIGIVSRNLVTTSNFVEFRNSRGWHFFRYIEYRVP